jgi:DNA recombination protein RmuC
MLAANGNSEETDRHRRAFHRSVRARVDEVAAKYIRPGDGTFEFALMYVPAERVYYEAVSANADDVMGYALDRHVVLVSPNTLYAYLSAMLHGLRGYHVQRNARHVADLLGALRSTVNQIIRVHDTIGRHLDNAVKQHTEATRHVQRLDTQLTGMPGIVPGGSQRPSRPFVGPAEAGGSP